MAAQEVKWRLASQGFSELVERRRRTQYRLAKVIERQCAEMLLPRDQKRSFLRGRYRSRSINLSRAANICRNSSIARQTRLTPIGKRIRLVRHTLTSYLFKKRGFVSAIVLVVICLITRRRMVHGTATSAKEGLVRQSRAMVPRLRGLVRRHRAWLSILTMF